MSVAKRGNNVKVHYTGTLEDGTVFDSSAEREPLEFAIGSGEVIEGFSDAVLGMAIGEKRDILIPVEKAYGERKNEMVMSFDLSQVPEDLNPQLGDRMEIGGPDGNLLRVIVVDITDKEIILDGNPPLAGKNLNFSLELLDITM
ncbi:MAG: peptidylprolyl isomerase [Desulfotalea sp.]